MEKGSASSWTKTGSYGADFREVSPLGRGGQGSVFKAVHILDKKEYAVKKVPFYKNRGELLREVHALSGLSHRNIVRYHSSWIEDDEKSDGDSSVVFGSKEAVEPPNFHLQADDEDDDDEWVDDDADEEGDEDNKDEDADESEEESDETEEYSSILYIQMELCTSTLRGWLDKRNEGVASTIKEKGNIIDKMHQILQGVKFIHEHGLIHRDLKPDNIFLQGDLVKIGDFGLAKGGGAGEAETQSNSKSDVHNQRYCVGTSPYAAPEMVSCSTYNEKSDIYSVGVIFLEMCYKMVTWQEKAEKAGELQKGQVPKELKSKSWKKEMTAMIAMCQIEADIRPSADQLLCGPLFFTQEQEIELLKERVKQKNAKIKQLGQRLRKASPHSLLAKLRKMQILLEVRTAQLRRLEERYMSTELSGEESAVIERKVQQSGFNFPSQITQEFFMKMCKGMSVLVTKCVEDMLYLLVVEMISSGISTDAIQEFGSYERLLENSFEVAHGVMIEDALYESKLMSRMKLFEQNERLRALTRPAFAQGAQRSGREGKRRRRRRSGKGNTKGVIVEALPFQDPFLL